MKSTNQYDHVPPQHKKNTTQVLVSKTDMLMSTAHNTALN